MSIDRVRPESLREMFEVFQELLELNTVALKIISDLEDKVQQHHMLDMVYLHRSLSKLSDTVRSIIDSMIALGGDDYRILRVRFTAIDEEIAGILPGGHGILKDDLTIPLRGLRRARAYSVGSKSANLGEMKCVLNLPVPGGFAISAWGYLAFLKQNDLQERINRRLSALDYRRYEELKRVSAEIQRMILASPVPDDLAEAIEDSCLDLLECRGSDRFSLRSSAVGEDSLLSFAGQYATFLNIHKSDLLNCYRKIIASKFTPKAIFYLLCNAPVDIEPAMSVCCIEMVDAVSSGVLYTRNPVDPDDGLLLVSSIFGLGKYLVDGNLAADTFHVRRSDGEVIRTSINYKPVKLETVPEGGVIEREVPMERRCRASVSGECLELLTKYALAIEKHYGSPQDVEWAIDREGGLFFLQTRPLRMIRTDPRRSLPEELRLNPALRGGETVCHGVSAGPLRHLRSPDDFGKIADGAVIVAARPMPGMVTLMSSAKALVIESGGLASHFATLAREFRVPTLIGIKGMECFPSGTVITVDATDKAIYRGEHRALLEAAKPATDFYKDEYFFNLVKEILQRISTLNLVDPGAEGFDPAGCRSLHDLTRYCHQQAIREMNRNAAEYSEHHAASKQLRTEIPLIVHLVYLDDSKQARSRSKWVDETDIGSEPMQAIWDGIRQEGWPSFISQAKRKSFGRFTPKKSNRFRTAGFEESSLVVLSRDYMVFSIHLGYHITTVEAMCSNQISQNFIRLQHKGGGAAFERRVRRVNLITSILSRLGFINSNQADFLDARLEYQDMENTLDILKLIGRLNMRTKQLDMALINDDIAEWYQRDIMKRLGMEIEGTESVAVN